MKVNFKSDKTRALCKNLLKNILGMTTPFLIIFPPLEVKIARQVPTLVSKAKYSWE